MHLIVSSSRHGLKYSNAVNVFTIHIQPELQVERRCNDLQLK